MKKMITIILAVVLTISLFGCATVNGNDLACTTDPSVIIEPTLGDCKHAHGDALKSAGVETTEPTTEAPTEAPTEPSVTGHKHSYTDTVTNPTCEGKGYTEYVCQCGDSYRDNETAATGHDYKTTVIAPTQSSQGYDLHECTKCSKSYKDNYTDKLPTETQPPHNHSYTNSVVAPTCAGNGYTKYTCACGDSYTGDEKPALGHDYVTQTVNSVPAMQIEGYYLHTCKNCGFSYKENMPDTDGGNADHKGKYYFWGEWIAWDCAGQGHHWHTYPTSPGEDTYKRKTIREATCTQLEFAEFYCDVEGCGASEQREIANSYAKHLRSADTITGLKHMWQLRLIDGYSRWYTSEEEMKDMARHHVARYKNGESTLWVEHIWEIYSLALTDTYVCHACGQTLDNNSDYSFVGELPYKGYTVQKNQHTKYNQPEF